MEQQHGFPLPAAPCFPQPSRASVIFGCWHLEKQLCFFVVEKKGDINIPQKD